MDRVVNRMSRFLFWGLTVNTQVARYYAFYPWVIERSEAQDSQALLDDIIRAEKAYALAALLAHDGERCVVGLAGADLMKSYGIQGRDAYDLRGIKWYSRGASGFGQLYRGPLIRLRLVGSKDRFMRVTARGKRLAEAYDRNVAFTEYAKKYFNKDVVPASVLTAYGRQACPCALFKRGGQELDLLRQLFFESEANSGERQLALSLYLVMDILWSANRCGWPFSNRRFKLATFYNQLADDTLETYRPYQTPHVLEETRTRWRLFQAHGYFSFALETFLAALLDMAEDQPKQQINLDTFKEVLEEADAVSLLEDYLVVDLAGASLNDLTLRQIGQAVLSRFPTTEIGVEGSERFDTATSLESMWSEYRIASRLASLNKGRIESIERVIGALAMLMNLYIRFYHYHRRVPQTWRWYLARSSEDALDMSLSKWMYLHPNLLERSRSVADFLAEFLDTYILRRQLQVAEERKYDTAWFSEAGLDVVLAQTISERRYSFNYPYELVDPYRFTSKVSRALDILRTLDYCKGSGSTLRLTQDGLDRLRYIREIEQ